MLQVFPSRCVVERYALVRQRTGRGARSLGDEVPDSDYRVALRDDSLRRIAIFRIEGFTAPEIADELRVSTRTVERKLKLIREAWSKEL